MEAFKRKPTISETELLRQFKKNISDVLTPLHTDAYLMKWIRAGNFNIRKSEQFFREALATRALYSIDSFADHGKEPKVAEDFGFAVPIGFAKDGTPVTYAAFGRGDLYGFVASLSSYDLCLYGSYWFEKDLKRAREQSKRLGKEINQVTYIVDMEDFSLARAARTCVIESSFDLLRLMQDIYPELGKNMFVVNAAFYFYQAFNVLKPVFRKSFLKDVYVVSKEDTPALLLKYIDADVLPAFLGGNRVDSKGDPFCREFMKFGGPIPTDYHLSRLPPLLPSDPGVESVYIPARGVYNHSLIVRAPKSRLHIEMRAEGGSVSTAILFREFGSDPNHPDIPPSDVYLDENNEECNVRLISPCVKLQLHISPADLHCNLPWAGIYIFRFDNSCNWVSGRNLILRLQIIAPNS
ncbi:SEC14-like protein 2 [Argiope bruennichi]|uniref:SEC14-like protein 2 n=1 Tax=Argiope bruennichi TaxID=94029 RepID=UPI0024947C3C|nr:SEC14-like protein 2 [Argiope bruennichi]